MAIPRANVELGDPLLDAMIDTTREFCKAPYEDAHVITALVGRYPCGMINSRLDIILEKLRAQ